MSFDFTSHIRIRGDGIKYITIPVPTRDKAPVDATVKVHVDIVLEADKKKDEVSEDF